MLLNRCAIDDGSNATRIIGEKEVLQRLEMHLDVLSLFFSKTIEFWTQDTLIQIYTPNTDLHT
jgi:hypothetical protein